MNNSTNQSTKSYYANALTAQEERKAAIHEAEMRLKAAGETFPIWVSGNDPVVYHTNITNYGEKVSKLAVQIMKEKSLSKPLDNFSEPQKNRWARSYYED